MAKSIQYRTATEARQQFLELLRGLEAGEHREPVMIMRHGRPVGVLMNVVSYRQLEAAKELVDDPSRFERLYSRHRELEGELEKEGATGTDDVTQALRSRLTQLLTEATPSVVDQALEGALTELRSLKELADET